MQVSYPKDCRMLIIPTISGSQLSFDWDVIDSLRNDTEIQENKAMQSTHPGFIYEIQGSVFTMGWTVKYISRINFAYD